MAKIRISRTNKNYSSIPCPDKLWMKVLGIWLCLEKDLAFWVEPRQQLSITSVLLSQNSSGTGKKKVHDLGSVCCGGHLRGERWSVVLNCWVQKPARFGSLLHLTALHGWSFTGLDGSCCGSFQWNTAMVTTQIMDYFSSKVRSHGSMHQISSSSCINHQMHLGPWAKSISWMTSPFLKEGVTHTFLASSHVCHESCISFHSM